MEQGVSPPERVGESEWWFTSSLVRFQVHAKRRAAYKKIDSENESAFPVGTQTQATAGGEDTGGASFSSLPHCDQAAFVT